jgi:hypothetical protein
MLRIVPVGKVGIVLKMSPLQLYHAQVGKAKNDIQKCVVEIGIKKIEFIQYDVARAIFVKFCQQSRGGCFPNLDTRQCTQLRSVRSSLD